MITVKTLKELLDKLPDDAKVSVYEGEDTGISIDNDADGWWIRARFEEEEDNFIQGFDNEGS